MALQKLALQETVGGKTLTLQTGTIAKQASGSVTSHLGETVTLSAVTASWTPKEVSFVPLTSDYRERTYAAGRIPGGFFKRENRPREKEVLSSRLIDRPIRPLFPPTWNFETMVQTVVISSDLENDADVLAITGASAALMLSEVPWNGPVAAVRICRINGAFVLFPTFEERETAEMELVVAGKKGALLMVEGSANEVAEEVFAEALEVASREIDKLCDLQLRLMQESERNGRKVVKRDMPGVESPKPVVDFVSSRALKPIREALRAKADKAGLDERIDALKDSLKKDIEEAAKTDPALTEGPKLVSTVIEDLLYNESRQLTLVDRIRPDGRRFDEIRQISIQTPVLARLHGSALFTRGQTQALVTATLGTPADMQILDVLEGEY
ncbi:MAG: polyribonucleotide nucleotidyltransferase, partial [Elusimicrobia bacterium]|nr:polyribonucleotide nucleotidyltransferase [Elusimicrobiota bacterium]